MSGPGGVGVWLEQVELRLQLAGIPDERTKYAYLASSLPAEITSQVYDLITTEPTSNPFTTLIERIRSEFEPTDTAQVKKLLDGLKRGNTKPSLFLREMRDLAKKRVDDVVLRQLFYGQLPANVAETLTLTNVTDLDLAAQAADRAWERESQASVSAISERKTETSADPKIDALTEQLSKLAAIIDRLQARENDSRRSRNRSATPGRCGSSSCSGSRRNTKWTKCWYHYKFGPKATKCEEWCEFWQTKKPEN